LHDLALTSSNINYLSLVYRNCDICGQCDAGDNDYDDYDSDNFGDPPEIDPKINSNFGRKKREAGNRRVRATVQKKCIRFSIR
jgi:hypothetical protein